MINKIKSHFKLGQAVYIKGLNKIYKGYITGINFHKDLLKDKRLTRHYWVQGIMLDGTPHSFYSQMPKKKIYATLFEAEKKTGLKLWEAKNEE